MWSDPPHLPLRLRRSLRFRLLAATLLALLLALSLAGLLLTGLFRDHVMRQFDAVLTTQLDQVTARLDFDAAGQPQLQPQRLSDPRWSQPYSGLYWQVDRADAAPPVGLLRSRSLWDDTLAPPADVLADGERHVHRIAGPRGAQLMLVERTVRPPDSSSASSPASSSADTGRATAWRVMVAADLGETEAAVARFGGVLAASLAILLLLLGAAAWAQVAVGLAPLRALQRALVAVHEGRSARLDDPVPLEVQPLVEDFNRVLDRNAEVVTRARTQAGNLAHALKTPLAALAQAAAEARRRPPSASDLPALVDEQVRVAQRHVDWHLARSRAAAAHGLPGARAAVAPAVAGLLRVMARVHAERGLDLRCEVIAPDLHFAGEAQDLQEMVGNLLDNACKWARHTVRLQATATAGAHGPRLHIGIEDDGPGIAPERRAAVLARGTRLDESVPGSGLGLAIVQELVDLYGGRLSLVASTPTPEGGGLRIDLELPGGR